jgi:hypothetical protein
MRKSKPLTRPSREYGGAMVEFSISIMFFIWLCLIICDLLQFSYRTVSAQHIVGEFMRNVSQGDFADVPAIESGLINRARASGIELTSNNIRICTLEIIDPNCDFGSSGSVGFGRDLVSITIQFPFRFMSWGGSYPIEADAIGRNEPF